ncbi:hypothetical protein [Halorubrum ezzemoulense]|uniref:hypothetical protein n=1 Tax=Halorubrum ezzemoulense TaxID=337243 RepID=UPI0011817A90|nr:hypothetical protein [Halorubrum ezzemoulense]
MFAGPVGSIFPLEILAVSSLVAEPLASPLLVVVEPSSVAEMSSAGWFPPTLTLPSPFPELLKDDLVSLPVNVTVSLRGGVVPPTFAVRLSPFVRTAEVESIAVLLTPVRSIVGAKLSAESVSEPSRFTLVE